MRAYVSAHIEFSISLLQYLAVAAGFEPCFFDLAIDAYEKVKTQKNCAFRIRLTGDDEWHDVTEIENVQDLNRHVTLDRSFFFFVPPMPFG